MRKSREDIVDVARGRSGEFLTKGIDHERTTALALDGAPQGNHAPAAHDSSPEHPVVSGHEQRVLLFGHESEAVGVSEHELVETGQQEGAPNACGGRADLIGKPRAAE